MTQTPDEQDPTGERGDERGGALPDDGDGGQVSQVSGMEDPDLPIQPDQSVAGSPDDEPGGVDEGAQGPNADPNAGARKT